MEWDNWPDEHSKARDRKVQGEDPLTYPPEEVGYWVIESRRSLKGSFKRLTGVLNGRYQDVVKYAETWLSYKIYCPYLPNNTLMSRVRRVNITKINEEGLEIGDGKERRYDADWIGWP